MALHLWPPEPLAGIPEPGPFPRMVQPAPQPAPEPPPAQDGEAEGGASSLGMALGPGHLEPKPEVGDESC